MTITYTFHPQYDLVVTRLSGVVDEKELLGSYRYIYSDPRIRPGHNELTDGRDLTSATFRGNALIALVTMGTAFHGEKRSTTRVAHLLSSTYQVGISNMYDAYANAFGKRTVRRFADARQALNWLHAFDLTPEAMHQPEP